MKEIDNERSRERARLQTCYQNDLDSYDKLRKLAVSFGVKPSTLQKMMVRLCVNNEGIINELQRHYQRDGRSVFRVIPTRVNGEMTYVFPDFHDE